MAEGLPFRWASSRWQGSFQGKKQIPDHSSSSQSCTFCWRICLPSISQSYSISNLCDRFEQYVSTFCVRRRADRIQSQARDDAARSIVDIQMRSLTQFRSCVALVLERSRISDRDFFGVGSLSTCCEAPLARARLKPSEHHPTGVSGLCLKNKCATFEKKRLGLRDYHDHGQSCLRSHTVIHQCECENLEHMFGHSN